MPALSHAYFIKPTGANEFVGFSGAAVQSLSVTTNTPRNPLSALGYKGVVGWIDQPQTADITIEEFIPYTTNAYTTATVSGTQPAGTKRLTDVASDIETEAAGTNLTIYGATGCSVTGVTFNFTAGQPGRATWTLLGKGGNVNMTSGTPLEGTGNEKNVLLWHQPQPVAYLWDLDAGSETSYDPSGVQTITFNGTINRDTLFALGVEGVYQYVVTYPINVTVTVESYGGFCAATATDVSGYIGFGPVRALSCRRTSRGQSVTVGGYRTTTENFAGADLEWYTS